MLCLALAVSCIIFLVFTCAFRPLAPDFPFLFLKQMKNHGFCSQNPVHFGVDFDGLLGPQKGFQNDPKMIPKIGRKQLASKIV